MKKFNYSVWSGNFIGVNQWIRENSDKDFLVFVRDNIYEVPDDETLQKYCNTIYDSGIVMLFHGITDKVNKTREGKITAKNLATYDENTVVFLPTFYPGIVVILNKVITKLNVKILEQNAFIDAMKEIYDGFQEYEMVPPNGWYPDVENAHKNIKTKNTANNDISATFASPTNCPLVDLEVQALLQRIEKNYSNKRKLFE